MARTSYDSDYSALAFIAGMAEHGSLVSKLGSMALSKDAATVATFCARNVAKPAPAAPTVTYASTEAELAAVKAELAAVKAELATHRAWFPLLGYLSHEGAKRHEALSRGATKAAEKANAAPATPATRASIDAELSTLFASPAAAALPDDASDATPGESAAMVATAAATPATPVASPALATGAVRRGRAA